MKVIGRNAEINGIILLSLFILTIFFIPAAFALPNPAAVYCEEMGYKYVIDKTEDGERGVCLDSSAGSTGVHSQKSREVPIVELMRYANEAEMKTREMGREKSYDISSSILAPETKMQSIPFGSAPLSFDWRSKDGKNWVTPIKDQATCGSCWAFAATGITESKFEINLNNPDLNPDLSEQNLVSCSSAGDCNGGLMDEAINYIKNAGIVDEGCFPYKGCKSLDPYTYECIEEWACSLCQNSNEKLHKVKSWTRIVDSETAIALLTTEGPITIGFEVYTDFYFYSGGIYQYSWGLFEGPHAMILVGYNDNDGYWIVKNSWGTGWGESGYARISYSEPIYLTYYGTYPINSVIQTDWDTDGAEDGSDNCPYEYNTDQKDVDNNGVGDVCDCMPDWKRDYNPCLPDDRILVTYTDANNCHKTYGLPADAGTYESCDYCQEEILGSFYTNWSNCSTNDTVSRIKYYIDTNFSTCCAVTSLESDCNILSGYKNVTETQSCDFCQSNWSCAGYDTCQPDDNSYCDNVTDLNYCYDQTNLSSDLYQGNYSEFLPQTCDHCVPNWTCSGYFCNITDIGYCDNVTDLNYCHEQTNLSSDEYYGNYTEFPNQTCDYCQENVTALFTNWSECGINDTKTRTRYYVDVNYESCYAVTDLDEDHTMNNGSYENSTEFQPCDFCMPDWKEILTECLSDDIKIGWFNDTKQCYSITNLSSDYEGKPDNVTYKNICDYDENGIVGNLTAINTTIQNITMSIGNSTNLANIFNGTENVKFIHDNFTIIEFDFNFSYGFLNLANITLEKQANTSTTGFMIISGIDLTGQNKTKNVYIDKLTSSNGVCIKDEEITSITEISDNCKGNNELFVKCPGTNGKYSCEFNSTLKKYKVSGLSHSGISEQQTYCGDEVCSGGESCSSCPQDCGECPPSEKKKTTGGGGGFSGLPPPCSENWTCTDWSQCINGEQARTCGDVENCGTEENKPSEIRTCVVQEEKDIKDTKVCDLGERKCSGDNLLECNSTESDWNLIQICEYGCSDGVCDEQLEIEDSLPTGLVLGDNYNIIVGALILVSLISIGVMYWFRVINKKARKSVSDK